jgi:hypothetical protein
LESVLIGSGSRNVPRQGHSNLENRKRGRVVVVAPNSSATLRIRDSPTSTFWP